jgi:hypothetical protein
LIVDLQKRNGKRKLKNNEVNLVFYKIN